MPIGEIVASVVNAASNMYQQKKQSQHEKSLQERQFRESREMAEYQYSKDLEQWERANQYNAPIQQMARYKDAGLNPHLIYGQGSPGNTATTLPKYQAPRPQYTYANPTAFQEVGNILRAYNDFRLANAQIDLVRNQAKVKGDEAQYSRDLYFGRSGQAMTRFWTDKHKYNWMIRDREGQSNWFNYMDYQLQGREAQIRNIESQIDYRDKLNSLYQYKLFGQLGLQALKGFIPIGRVKGVGGKFKTPAGGVNVTQPRRIMRDWQYNKLPY